jgi:hypothetical protein
MSLPAVIMPPSGKNNIKSIIGSMEKTASKNVILRLYRYYIIDSIFIVRKEGFKSLLKKRGWKIFAIVIGYYVVRDTVVYILIPYLITKNII